MGPGFRAWPCRSREKFAVAFVINQAVRRVTVWDGGGDEAKCGSAMCALQVQQSGTGISPAQEGQREGQGLVQNGTHPVAERLVGTHLRRPEG